MAVWEGDDQRGLPIVDPELGVEMPAGGTWYQPRSLWSAAFVENLSGQDRMRVRLPRQHFHNGTRWPIVLKRMSICPINFPMEFGGDAALTSNGAQPFDFAYGALSGSKVRFSAPFRKSFSRNEIVIGSMPALPTGQQRGPRAYQSSLFGTSYLNLDMPLHIPRNSTCMIGLGGLSGTDYQIAPANIDFTGEGLVSLPNAPGLAIRSYLYFNEVGGKFSGNQRAQYGFVPVFSGAAQTDAFQKYPFPLPSNHIFGTGEVGEFAGFENWPPAAQLQGKRFGDQQVTQAGSSHIYGMGVCLDQIVYDDRAGTDAADNGVNIDGSGFKIAALSTRIGCRAHMPHGINTDWWWRPGAPLALVLDTITPAVVYELPQAITLGPGDGIEVELDLAGNDFLGQLLQEPHRVNVGVSFNGYTMVEG